MTARLIKTIMVFSVAGLLTACGLKTDREIAYERVNAYLTAHPELDPKLAGPMRELELVKGMTPTLVTATWGEPAIIQKSDKGNWEMWLFPCEYPHHCESTVSSRKVRTADYRYLSNALFVDGKLTEWKN